MERKKSITPGPMHRQSAHPPGMRTVVVSKAALAAQLAEVSAVLCVFRTAAAAKPDAYALELIRGLCSNDVGVESVTPLSDGRHRVVLRRADGTILELLEP